MFYFLFVNSFILLPPTTFFACREQSPKPSTQSPQGSTLPPPNAAQPLHATLPRKSPQTASHYRNTTFFACREQSPNPPHTAPEGSTLPPPNSAPPLPAHPPPKGPKNGLTLQQHHVPCLPRAK